MLQLLSHENVNVVKSDQCMYGLYTPSKDGAWMLARKPTQWASSSPQMLARLSKRCNHEHEHQRLEGGRASDAELYPPALIKENNHPRNISKFPQIRVLRASLNWSSRVVIPWEPL